MWWAIGHKGRDGAAVVGHKSGGCSQAHEIWSINAAGRSKLPLMESLRDWGCPSGTSKSYHTFTSKPLPFAVMLFLYFIQQFLYSLQAILYHFAPSGNLVESFATDFNEKRFGDSSISSRKISLGEGRYFLSVFISGKRTAICHWGIFCSFCRSCHDP